MLAKFINVDLFSVPFNLISLRKWRKSVLFNEVIYLVGHISQFDVSSFLAHSQLSNTFYIIRVFIVVSLNRAHYPSGCCSPPASDCPLTAYPLRLESAGSAGYPPCHESSALRF